MAHLTEVQRYEIYALMKAGETRKKVCELIGKYKSLLIR